MHSSEPLASATASQLALANYRIPGDTTDRAGLILGDVIHDLGRIVRGKSYPSLASAYDDWDAVDKVLRRSPVGLDDAVPVADVAFLAPSLTPSSLYFAGFNYRDHVANMMKVFDLPDDPDPKAAGLKPWHNLKPRNTLCGPGATVTLPTARVDWEIELAVVIGRPARDVDISAALDHVAGYTIGIDLSARDRAFRPNTPVESVARMDWIAQKGFQGACPLGPWLVPACMIDDPQSLKLRLSVNDVVKQDSTTQEMIFTVAEAVAHLSSMVLLSPGDVILTGTPAGTGAERGEALAPGDVIRASIEHIGELIIYTA